MKFLIICLEPGVEENNPDALKVLGILEGSRFFGKPKRHWELSPQRDPACLSLPASPPKSAEI